MKFWLLICVLYAHLDITLMVLMRYPDSMIVAVLLIIFDATGLWVAANLLRDDVYF